MMPKVLNKNRFNLGGIYVVRGSKWGNPFRIGEHGTREECIDAYYQYLKTRPDLLLAQRRIE